MQFERIFAEFTHVAERQPGCALERTQNLNTRFERIRVSIVAIVNQATLVGSLHQFQAPFNACKTIQAGHRLGQLLLLAFVGAVLAIALSEDLRKSLLDRLFGAEEEFEYTSTTTPPAPPAASG